MAKNSPLLKQFKRDIEAMETETQDESEDDLTPPKGKMAGGRMMDSRMGGGRMMAGGRMGGGRMGPSRMLDLSTVKDTGRMSGSVKKSATSTPAKDK